MPLLELRAVSKSFGGLTAVRDVSLSLAEKEVRAIIGPNGAGKSTLFNIIAGTFSPSAGDIIFNGSVACRTVIVRNLPARHLSHVSDHLDLPRPDRT